MNENYKKTGNDKTTIDAKCKDNKFHEMDI